MSRPGVMGTLVLVGTTLASLPAAAQETRVREQLDPVLTAAAGTPDGAGLVTTALAEARIAAQEASRAAVSTDLGAMQTHARGVLHAVDPALVARGPGLGYGVRRAVRETQQLVETLAAADSQADVARFAPRALTAAGNVLAWSDALVAAAQRVVAADSAAAASAAAQEMVPLAAQLTAGVTGATRRVTVTPGEAGLLGLRLSLRTLLVTRETAVATRQAVTR